MKKITMKFLTLVPLASLLLCASCGNRDFSVKPKKNPYLAQNHSEKLDKTKMTPKEYQKKKRALQRHRYALFSKPVIDMTIAELQEAKDLSFADGEIKHGLHYLERIAAISDNLNQLRDLRLEIADLYFEMGDLEKAESLYSEFLTLYPGSKAIEYAEYKAILSSFYQTLESDFDQTKTKQTIQLAQSFLGNTKNQHYAGDVVAVKKECLTTLFNSEVSIINFYLEKNKFDGAQQRLANLKEQFANLEGADTTMAALEYELTKKQGLELPALTPTASAKDGIPVVAQNTATKNYSQRF